MEQKKIKLELGWEKILETEFKKEYFQKIKNFLVTEINQGKNIYPIPKNIFSAFNQTPLKSVKVVILGQDPYHSFDLKGGIPHAHGLSFSIPKQAKKIPPSLQNIFKELQTDIPNFQIPNHGNLDSWAKQGVLCLNAALTVEAGRANSHASIGWYEFSDAVIKKLSEQKENLVFILWGNFARAKKDLIDLTKHKVIESPHPSPFSAHNGFFGSRPFSQTNAYLSEQGIPLIDWTDLNEPSKTANPQH